MTRVYIICEGKTEVNFVKQLLLEPFAYQGIYLSPTLLGTTGHKGGRVQFDRLRDDLKRYLLHDKTAICTTFFDFYALPTDFPGKAEADKQIAVADKAQSVCTNLADKLAQSIDSLPMARFIPYVQMHEFEALLFSDPQSFATGISQPEQANALKRIRESFASPEEINDSPLTAPSKRILALMPKYQKPIDGIIAAQSIGLTTIRKECRLFDGWLKQLEQLRSSESA